MATWQRLSAVDQLTAHLRNELLSGRWSETMPGVHRLAADLSANRKTVESALSQLEAQGLLVGQGPGRRRKIALPKDAAPPALRVAVLLLGRADRGDDFVLELRHRLEEAGHVPFYPEKTMRDLGMDAGRIARFAKRTEADAWVIASASREVLQWFSQQPKPAFAVFGRRDELPIAGAGPDKSPPTAVAARHLIELGHRRITFLIRKQHRPPNPTPSVRAFLDELAAHDIEVGEFNLPDWEETKAGYQEILESLFHLTPPTAIIADEAFQFIAAQQFLARRGLRVPEDVSLISSDSAPSFSWCEPAVTHIQWDYRPVARCVVRWAANVSRGKHDLRQTSTKAEFVKGGTVGPVEA